MKLVSSNSLTSLWYYLQNIDKYYVERPRRQFQSNFMQWYMSGILKSFQCRCYTYAGRKLGHCCKCPLTLGRFYIFVHDFYCQEFKWGFVDKATLFQMANKI